MNFPPRVNSGKIIFRLKIKWEINKFLHDFQHLYPSRKIPRCPSYPTMIHELVFSVGEKRVPPPTPLHLGICIQSIGWPTSQWRDWLIASGGWGLMTSITHANKGLSYSLAEEITDVKISLLFLLPTGQGGGGFWICLKFSQFAKTQLPRTSFSYFTCHHYLTD